MNGEIAIAWANLSYKVKPYWFGAHKTILNQLYGSVVFGSIIALMGPSGAGKTTLLKCLNGKMRTGLDKKSKIYLNADHTIRSCYVGQHESEHLIMSLTAKQNMIYASKLKNSDDKNIPKEFTHENNVTNILNELLIGDIRDTRVDKCSGGEQKRLSIAMEMTKVNKPNMMCIDEPTTGLDSNAAQNLMQCLSNLCKTYGIAIIASIHQPNNEIVMSFDRLYVLAKGGHCVFDGHPAQIVSHLEECDIICNEHKIPIEQLLRLASIEETDDLVSDLISRTRLNQMTSIGQGGQGGQGLKLSAQGIGFNSKSFSFVDMWYVMGRMILCSYVTQWTDIFYQLLFYTLLGVFSAQMFDEDIGKPDACFYPSALSNNTCLKELEDDSLLFQNQNFIFFTSTVALFAHLIITAVSYVNDVKIFLNEHQNRWYSTGSFFMAKILVDFAPTLLYAISLSFLSYYLSGQLLEVKRVVPYMGVILLAFLCIEGITVNMCVLFLENEQLVILLSITTMLSTQMFSNFYILLSELPELFQHYSELSMFKFVFNSCILLFYGRNRCSSDQLSIILVKYGVSDDQLWPNVCKLILYVIITRIMAFVLLLCKTNISLNWCKCTEKDVIDNDIELEDIESTVHTSDRCKRRLSSIVAHHKSTEAVERGVYLTNNISLTVDHINNNNPMERRIIIAWNDLTLRISKSFLTKETTILRQLNGFFEFGSLNALMGTSGAGKTSLLKCINGLYSEYMSEDTNILLSNVCKVKNCFIVQNVKEHLLCGLTGRQALLYSSKLKNADKDFDHESNVSVLMSELLISGTADTNVEKCSGGEQKRIVIAMELTSRVKPNLICIDEPTSGLDSNVAQEVIECLKQLSLKHNICVISSIHQPNNDILILFDRLYVMAKGGSCVYAGPPQQLSHHLLECGIDFNEEQLPIEVLLKYSCNGLSDLNVQKMAKKTAIDEKDVICKRMDSELTVFPEGVQKMSKRFLLRDLWLCLMRYTTHMYRYYWKIFLLQTIVFLSFGQILEVFFNDDIVLPSGCINIEDDYNNTCARSEEKIIEENKWQLNLKYHFFILDITLFFVLITTTINFTTDVKMFINEHRNGWYSTGVFYWSKAIVEVVTTSLPILLYSFLVNKYLTQNPQFFYYLFAYLTLGSLVIQTVGHFIGTLLAHNQRMAIFTTVGVFIYMFLFCNFFTPVDKLHYALQELSRLSTVRLVVECIFIYIYGFDRCSDRQFSAPLNLFTVEDDDFYSNTQLLILQFIIFRALTVTALLIKVNPTLSTRQRKGINDITEYDLS